MRPVRPASVPASRYREAGEPVWFVFASWNLILQLFPPTSSFSCYHVAGELLSKFQRKYEAYSQEFCPILPPSYLNLWAALSHSLGLHISGCFIVPSLPRPLRHLTSLSPLSHITSASPYKLPCQQPLDLLSPSRSEPSPVAPTKRASSLLVPASLQFIHTPLFAFLWLPYSSSPSDRTALC